MNEQTRQVMYVCEGTEFEVIKKLLEHSEIRLWKSFIIIKDNKPISVNSTAIFWCDMFVNLPNGIYMIEYLPAEVKSIQFEEEETNEGKKIRLFGRTKEGVIELLLKYKVVKNIYSTIEFGDAMFPDIMHPIEGNRAILNEYKLSDESPLSIQTYPKFETEIIIFEGFNVKDYTGFVTLSGRTKKNENYLYYGIARFRNLDVLKDCKQELSLEDAPFII